jgi:signal transduction histidine kinase
MTMNAGQSTERERIRALRSYDILDTAPEVAFDNVTAMCAQLLEVPIALVSLVDSDRQWFKSRVGLDLAQTERSIAFCDHAIRRDAPLIVEDTAEDARFANNPLVLSDPCVRFYAGVPLNTPEGFKLGTLCAIDTQPRHFAPREVELLVRLARQVELELELRRQTLLLDQHLARAEADRRRQEMFAAMIVHDLRNPLTAIALSAVAGLQDRPLADECLQEISAASERAQRMLADVLDICLARTGEVVPRRSALSVRGLLEATIESVSRYAADRHVRLALDTSGAPSVYEVDPDLLERALINLLENAIRFSPRNDVVAVSATAAGAGVTFCVEDHGPGIPHAEQARVFEPFVSLEAASKHRGLGLAFCKIAAEAHGGRTWVEDARPRGSRFLLHISRSAPMA